MKKFLYLFFMFLVLSCDTVEEIYLYDSDDPEHSILQTMAVEACIDDAEIFDALDNFENSNLVGNIYKIEQDANDEETIYVKIMSVSASEIVMRFNSSSDKYDKELTFTSDNHSDILSEIKTMACTEAYEDYFSTSGLDDNDSMTLTWKKETINSYDDDDEADDYLQRTDKYTIDNDYPLLFFFFNGVKTTVSKDEDDEEEETSTSNLTITEVTDEDECDDDTDNDDYKVSCAFEAGDRGYDDENSFDEKDCTIAVNLSTYTSNRFDDELISIEGDSDCELLESGE